MSIKRQIQYQFTSFIKAISDINLPSWLSSVVLRVCLLVVITFFGSAYVIKTASGASNGYKIYELEEQVADLELNIDKLNVEVAEYSSLASINSRLKNVNLVSVGSLTFYNGAEQVVAKR